MQILLRKESSCIAAGQVVDAVTCSNVIIYLKKAHHNLSRCCLESEQGLRNKKHEKYEFQ